MNEKELKQQVYEFGFEVAKFPSDENITKLKGMLRQVLSLSSNRDVNSKARLALEALERCLKYKKIDTRIKHFAGIADYLSRVAFYQ